jgi:chromosome partitioning protein
MNTIITIANQKGGVGKTTTAVVLATGFADLGYPTVLIDADSQGNVADFLNLEKRPALYELIIMQRRPKEIVQQVDGYPRLGVITGNEHTRQVENSLNAGIVHNPVTTFRDALTIFRSDNGARHTLIVIDTAPSLSAIQVSALNAADWLLIPATPEFASETGINALVQAVADLKDAGSNLQLLGILPTMVQKNTTEHRETVKDLHNAFPGLVLPSVHRRIALGEMTRHGTPIWKYDPDAAIDYGLVLDDVQRRIGL